jgi:hypothetical protein
MMCNHRKLRLLACLAFVTALGFALKYYRGCYRQLLNDSLAGVAYVIFWCLLLKLVFNKSSNTWIVALVVFVTCCLEFMQLWQPSFLQVLRAYWLGKTLLGTTFNYADIPFYFLGGIIALIILKKNPIT